MGNNYGMDSPRCLRDLVLQNLKTLIFLLCSQYPSWGGSKKVDDLPTSPINQFRDHSHRNRIEKLVPVNYQFATGFKKTKLKEINQTVFKLDFLQKSGFPKTRDLSPVAPRGPGGFIFPEMTPKTKYVSGNARKHQESYVF